MQNFNHKKHGSYFFSFTKVRTEVKKDGLIDFVMCVFTSNAVIGSCLFLSG